MLTNCLAECAHLTITVSQIKRDIGRKSSFFHTPPLHSTPKLGGRVPVGLAPSRLAGKTRMAWLPDGEKIRRYLYSFWPNSRTCQTDRQTDGQTDRHRMPAIAALMNSIARQKLLPVYFVFACHYLVDLNHVASDFSCLQCGIRPSFFSLSVFV